DIIYKLTVGAVYGLKSEAGKWRDGKYVFDDPYAGVPPSPKPEIEVNNAIFNFIPPIYTLHLMAISFIFSNIILFIFAKILCFIYRKQTNIPNTKLIILTNLKITVIFFIIGYFYFIISYNLHLKNIVIAKLFLKIIGYIFNILPFYCVYRFFKNKIKKEEKEKI
ncbi:MAG TPA: hypothetical protein PLJ38_12385, partial [bacterium]|nr:hypothetical protein [bacterium]